MISKKIDLSFEDCAIQLEADIYSGLITVRINEYVLDLEKSKPNQEVYKSGDVVEIYPAASELKEIIRALQQIIPEEDE